MVISTTHGDRMDTEIAVIANDQEEQPADDQHDIIDPVDETGDEELELLVTGVLEHGHRMTLSEAVATVLYDDHERSQEVWADYISGDNKVTMDKVTERLKQAGWYKRKVQRWNTRRLRWVNPAQEGMAS